MFLRFGLLVGLCLVVVQCEEEVIKCTGGECVKLHLCPNNELNTDGANIIDIRFNPDNECEDYLLKCCPIPDDDEGAGDIDEPPTSGPIVSPVTSEKPPSGPGAEPHPGTVPTAAPGSVPTLGGDSSTVHGTGPTSPSTGTGGEGTGNSGVSKPSTGATGGGVGSGDGKGKPHGHGGCRGDSACGGNRPSGQDDEQSQMNQLAGADGVKNANNVKETEQVSNAHGGGPPVTGAGSGHTAGGNGGEKRPTNNQGTSSGPSATNPQPGGTVPQPGGPAGTGNPTGQPGTGTGTGKPSTGGAGTGVPGSTGTGATGPAGTGTGAGSPDHVHSTGVHSIIPSQPEAYDLIGSNGSKPGQQGAGSGPNIPPPSGDGNSKNPNAGGAGTAGTGTGATGPAGTGTGAGRPDNEHGTGAHGKIPGQPGGSDFNGGNAPKPGQQGTGSGPDIPPPSGVGSSKNPNAGGNNAGSSAKPIRPAGTGTNPTGSIKPGSGSTTSNPLDKTVDVPQKCGVRNADGVGFRITGDNDGESEYGEFPWMVAILKEEKALDQVINVYQCGGSLIHPSVVLTAAHCVQNKKAAEIKVRLGEWDTQTKNEIYDYQDRNVVEIVTHAEFYKGGLFNDVALLFLDKPADLMETVNTICLPPADYNFDLSRCFASGWGKDVFGKQGTYQVILKKIELPIMPRTKCQEALRKTRLGSRFKLHKSFVCAGGEKGRDTCKGDGGSPLVCPIPGSVNQYYQAGMVAWGIGCGEDGVPGVYVNVPMFRGWIDEHLTQRNIPHSSFIYT